MPVEPQRKRIGNRAREWPQRTAGTTGSVATAGLRRLRTSPSRAASRSMSSRVSWLGDFMRARTIGRPVRERLFRRREQRSHSGADSGSTTTQSVQAKYAPLTSFAASVIRKD